MNFYNILCPIDFTEVSRRSLVKAVELAQKDKARLVVVHVVAETPWMVPPVPTMPVDMGRYQEELLKSARSKLSDMVNDNVPGELECKQVLETGSPGQEIVKLAKDSGVDLIVMASREDSALDRFLFGSVAEKVIRASTCPVLVLKEE